MEGAEIWGHWQMATKEIQVVPPSKRDLRSSVTISNPASIGEDQELLPAARTVTQRNPVSTPAPTPQKITISWTCVP